MNGRLTEGTTAGDLILEQPQIEPQAQNLFYFSHGHSLLGHEVFLHCLWNRLRPADVQRRLLSINTDSGTALFAFHIPSESVFTSPRNPYSPFPGTLIHMARIPHNDAAEQ
jgi:hypothetical protein